MVGGGGEELLGRLEADLRPALAGRALGLEGELEQAPEVRDRVPEPGDDLPVEQRQVLFRELRLEVGAL